MLRLKLPCGNFNLTSRLWITFIGPLGTPPGGLRTPKVNLCLGTPPPGTEGSRALRARNPKRVRKESVRVSGASGSGETQSPQRVRPGVRKESKNAASDSFRTPGCTLWGVWAPPGPLGPSPGALCARPGGSQIFVLFFSWPEQGRSEWFATNRKSQPNDIRCMQTLPVQPCCLGEQRETLKKTMFFFSPLTPRILGKKKKHKQGSPRTGKQQGKRTNKVLEA